MQGASPSSAFTELELALKERKDLDDVLTGAIVAAISGAASCAWPTKLLQGTLNLLSKGIEGRHPSLASFNALLCPCAQY